MSIAVEMLNFSPVDAAVLTATPGVALLVIYAEFGETWSKLYLHGELDVEIERKTVEFARNEIARRGHSPERLAVLRASAVASGND